MKKFAKHVSEYDMFGHVINLNFLKEGDSHKTAIGGVFSFIIKIAMTLYVFMNFKKMFLHEDDNNTTEYNLEDLEKIPPLGMRDTDFQMFHIVRKQASGKQLFWDDPEVHLNMDMYFIKKKYDWYKYPDPSYVTFEEIPARQCTVDDFIDDHDEKGPELYDSWAGFSLICPDMPEDNDFYLEGNQAMMKS